MLPPARVLLALHLLLSPVFAQQTFTNIDELKKKAEAGDAKAQNELGVAYRLGEGVLKDQQEALKWYLKSAHSRYADAMFNLGAMYYNGDGSGQDIERAEAWFTLAADAGSVEAKDALTHMMNEIPKPRPQIYERYVAEIYASIVGPDDVRSYEWYLKSASHHDAVSSYAVCQLLALGKGIRQDANASFHWCEVAAKEGSGGAIVELGDRYFSGVGCKQDYKKGLSEYVLASKLGVPQGLDRLAEVYREGKGVASDKTAAFSWSLLAYAAGYEPALDEIKAYRTQLTDQEFANAKKAANDWWKVNWMPNRPHSMILK